MNTIGKLSWVWPLCLLGFCLASVPAYGQIEGNLSAYTGPNAKGYLNPLKEGFGAALNCGSFRSGRVPESGLNIAVEIKAMYLTYANSDKSFLATTEPGFNPQMQVQAPTVIGDTNAVVVPGVGGSSAVLPGGFDIKSIGLAVPQVTIGSIYGTQAIGRYISFKTGNNEIGDIKLWGAGLRHSLSQYIPHSPVDVAASYLYQDFQLGSDLIKAKASSFGVQASRRFSILEPFVGVGFDSFSMKTSYTTKSTNPPTTLTVDFGQTSTFHSTAGVTLNLLVFHLTGEIDHSTQTSYLLGLSVGS